VNWSISDIKNTVIRRIVIVLFIPFCAVGVIAIKIYELTLVFFDDANLIDLISAIKDSWHGK